MKRITIVLAFLLCATVLFAQAPEKFTYQSVVRNVSNSLVANSPVAVRVSILQGSTSGNAVYMELHTATTNANGLLTLEIGGGTAQQGTFTDIDWANGPFFLKTETDPNGGDNYSITSTQQMLSVPYALYAKNAGNIPTVPANVSAFANDAGYITMDSVPSVPTNVSAFFNDANYLTNYTETDPQFNAWDKDYNDLVNTPTIPTVPTNVSAFINDAGYITGYTETDPNVPAWAKEATKPAYDYSEIANTPVIPTVPTNVSEFNNDAGYITMDSIPEIPTLPANVGAFNNDVGYITMDSVPTIPVEVSAFNNDAQYVSNAECADVDLCALANALSQLQALVEEQQSRIEELESLIGASDTTTTPIDTTTVTPTDTTSVTDGIPCPNAATVTDIDGNVYNTVQIGNQCWMRDNLRTTHYADGTVIPAGVSSLSSEEPFYYDYNSSAIPLAQRGYLYNWTAVMRSASSSNANPSGVQGICPTGWHVPSDAEWTQLTDYVSSQSEYLCSNNPEYIAKVLASTTEWTSSTYTCAVGNLQNLNNSTGFGTFPAGYRYNIGFTNSGKYAYFWSSTEASDGNAWYRSLHNNYAYVTRSAYGMHLGYSVRCLRNTGGGSSDTIQTSLPTVSIHTSTNETDSIVCSSEVTDNGGSPIISCGVCWSTNEIPTIEDNHTVDSMNNDGDFTSVINTSDWEPCGALYYFRSYATNSIGIAYSDVIMSLYVQKDTLAPYIQHSSPDQTPYTRLLPIRDNNCTYNAPSKEVMVNALLPMIHDDYTDMSFDYLMDHAEFYWENTNISAPNQNDIFNTHNHLTIVVVVEDQCGNELNHVVFYIDRPDDMTSITSPSITSSDTAICEGETVVLTFDSSKVESSYDFEVAHPLSFEWLCLENDVVFSNTNSVETVVTPNHSDTTCHFQMKVTDRYGCTAYSETCSVQVLDYAICHPSVPVYVQPCPGTPTVIDYDGNVYNTVQIGQQCWMKENLRTTREPDGTIISGRYYPNNDSNNVAVYGYLYHWFAVMNGASSSSANPSGVQGICPTGWHVPSNAEWTELETYLSSQSQYFCNNDSSYIAKALASTTGWNSPEGTSCLCCVGNNQSTNNATGFGALPSGDYYFDSSISFGDNAYFWSSTEISNGSARYCGLTYSVAHLYRYTSDKSNGHSVRCLRN